MIQTTDQCPSQSNLMAYATGNIDEILRKEIDDHIDHCEKCIGSLDQISSSDDFSFSQKNIKSANALLEDIKSDPEYSIALDHSLKLLSNKFNLSSDATGSSFGDFLIKREIGRGGMGVVYEAEQISLNRKVAIKILPYSLITGPNRKNRFQIESRAIASLHHPNIIPIYFSGEEHRSPYYVMPYIEGINLEQFIKSMKIPKTGKSHQIVDYLQESSPAFEILSKSPSSTDAFNTDALPEVAAKTEILNSDSNAHDFSLEPKKNYFDAIVHFGIQAASALQHAHEMGIIHRDVKPSNFMINDNGHLWVTDFGLAKFESSIGATLTGDIMGTVRYMSPEQALGKNDQISNRTDIYSLGVTLYELLALKPLFPDENKEPLFNHIINDDPVSPAKLNPSIPKELETIILKAISKEPENRYHSAGELKDDLNRFQHNIPILAKRPSAIDLIIKWSKRRKNFAAAIIFSFMFASLLSFVFMIVFSSKNSDLRKLNTSLEELNNKYENSLNIIREANLKSEISKQEAVAALHDARLNNYITTMKLASEAAAKKDTSLMQHLISPLIPKEDEPDLRGMEWFALNNSQLKNQNEIHLSSEALYVIAKDDTLKYVAAAGAESKIFLLDAMTLDLLNTIKSDQIEINGLDFTSDGKTLASTGDDGSIKIWKIPGCEFLREIEAYPKLLNQKEPNKVLTVRFAKDDKSFFTSAQDTVIKRWDTATGELIREYSGHKYYVNAFHLSEDGKLLVAGGQKEIISLWEVDGQKPVRQIKLPYQQTDFTHVSDFQFSNDSKTIAIACKDHFIYLWDLESNLLQVIGKHNDPVSSLFFSPDEKEIIAADKSGTIKIWDIEGRLTNQAKRFRPPLYSKSIHKGNLHSGLNGIQENTFLTVGQDGKLIQSVIDTLEVNSDLSRFDNVFDSSYCKQTGNLAFCSHDQFYFFNNSDGTLKFDWVETTNFIWSLTQTLSGDKLFTSYQNGFIRAWDINKKKLLGTWQVHPKLPIYDIKVSPDSKLLAYSIDEEYIQVLNLENDISKSIPPFVSGMEHVKGRFPKFSPTGELITFCRENTLYVRDIHSNEDKYQFQNHQGGIQNYIFTDDGKFLIVADGNRSIHVWDINLGRELSEPWKHTSDIYSLILTPDEKTLITSDKEGNITFWNFSKGQPLYSFSQPLCNEIILLNSGNLLIETDTLAGEISDYFVQRSFGKEWKEYFQSHLKANR